MDHAGLPHHEPFVPSTIQSTSMRCTQCGYDLSGAVIGGKCPECGMEIITSIRAASLPTSGRSVAAMVLGICSIVLGCASYGILSIICAPLAVIFAYQAQRDASAGIVGGGSRGMAVAGMVTGIIGCLFALIGLVLIVTIIVSIVAGP